MSTSTPLAIKGARHKISVSTGVGIFFKVLADGKPLSRKRGFWAIPMRNGSTAQLRAHGMMPGFQSLRIDGEVVHQFGAGIPTALKFLTLLPLVVVFLQPVVGAVLAVVLVFLNILGVRNENIPLRFRWVLPFSNTAAGAILAYAVSLLAQSAANGS